MDPNSQQRIEKDLSDKLELIRTGLTEAQAHAIVNAPLLEVPYDRTIMILGLLIVLIIIVTIYMIVYHTYDSYMQPWRVCDRWVDVNTHDEYVIMGYDPNSQSAKGVGPDGHFVVTYDSYTGCFTSTLGLGVAQMVDDKLRWSQCIWQRELLG